MSWTDIKDSLDSVETRVDLLKTTADLVTKEDTLERVDASTIVEQCELLISKLREIEFRASNEQELTAYASAKELLTVIRSEPDAEVVENRDKDGLLLSDEFSSVKVGKKVVRTRVYDITDGVTRLINKTYKVEVL